MIQGKISRSLWVNIAIGVFVVAVAAGLRVWPLQVLGSSLAWMTFYPAVMGAAVYGGFLVGILATGLSFLTVVFLWPLLVVEPFIRTDADWLGAAVFVVTGCVISGFALAMKRAQRRVTVLQTLVESMDEGFCVIEMIYDETGDPVDYRFLEVNPAFLAQTGLEQWSTRTMREMVPDHDAHWFTTYGAVAKTGKSIRFESSAESMQRFFDVFAFRVGSRKVGLLFTDISERKKAEQELLAIARYDSLTGLPNRAMFLDHLAKALARAERRKQGMAVMFLDLDGFKAVNDDFGHQVGDDLLRSVAQRLLSCVRAGDLVSRLGGDEFTIIVEDCQAGHLSVIAEKIVGVLEMPFDLDGRIARISTSIGIAIYPECASDADTLMEMADAAMYSVKKNGKSGHRFCCQSECSSKRCAHKALRLA